MDSTSWREINQPYVAMRESEVEMLREALHRAQSEIIELKRQLLDALTQLTNLLEAI